MAESLANRFVYHQKRPLFQGDHIHPLNTLKNIHPEAYQDAIIKYQGREDLVNIPVPGFDFLWNDAVFCAPIHPSKIVSALIQAGLNEQRRPHLSWFKIPLDRLINHRVVYYKYKDAPTRVERFGPDEFEEFSFKRYQEMDTVPVATQEDYRTSLAAGRRVFPFHLIPHVLVVGSIDIHGVEVITD